MKVLYIAPKSDFAHAVERALCDAGCEVTYLNDRIDYSVPEILRGSKMWWKLRRHIGFLRARSNAALQQQIILASARVDMVLAGKGMNIQPDTLQLLRDRNIKTVVWYPENPANEPYAKWVRTVGPVWDYFISFDSAIFHYMPEKAHARTHVVPFGAPRIDTAFNRDSNSDRERFGCDVVFVGAPYPDRVRLLERIASTCSLRIWGWQGWSATRLAHCYRGAINAADATKAYYFSKISMNTNVLPRANGVNLKTFEICAAGGFQLTDQCSDLPALFTPGVEVGVFDGEDDFVRQVQYWLSHDTERVKVAKAGYARAASEHTLERRISRILTIVRT